MNDFSARSVCILGRQPKLGLAELERLYGAEHIKPLNNAALLDVAVEDVEFRRLGGTIKLARVLAVIPTTSWPQLVAYLKDKIPEHLTHVPEGTFTLGLSVYGLKVEPRKINQDMLALKKVIRAQGRSVRIVPNKSTALNSAQVLHNKLTTRGAWELLFIKDGDQTVLAQTIFVQDIEAYAARDQARPKRDARVGMLPPKLAQIMVNLAKPTGGSLILDPFCGTGVVLQEALLMGFKAIGSDLDPRMVEYSKVNLEWLSTQKNIPNANYRVWQGDATAHEWLEDFDAVVSETYLGRPLTTLPAPDKLRGIVKDVNVIIEKSLLNLAQQLRGGTPLCLAVPAWRANTGKLIKLPLIAKLTDIGYNYLDLKWAARDELVYFREDQTVARQLLVLKKV